MTGVLGIPASGGVSVFVPYFEPAAVLDAIEQYRVNITLMVPIMVGNAARRARVRPERLATLESLVYGASPMPTGLLEHLLSTFPRARPVPGLRHDRGFRRPHACSAPRITDAAETRCARPAGRSTAWRSPSADEDGRELPVGQTGEVCARAGNFMREYWNRPEETAAAFRDGWYHSGDTGYVDEQGFLFIVDRLKDMIVTGGENVYSIEVENAISTHPAVAQVAVIGIPDDLWGEAVHAVVVLQPGDARDRRGAHRARAPDDRRLQGPQEHRVPHRSAPALGRAEAAEAGAAQALLGRPRTRGVTPRHQEEPR